MPESSLSGDVAYNDNQIGVKFSKAGSKRFLKCDFLDFYDSKNLYFNNSFCKVILSAVA